MTMEIAVEEDREWSTSTDGAVSFRKIFQLDIIHLFNLNDLPFTNLLNQDADSGYLAHQASFYRSIPSTNLYTFFTSILSVGLQNALSDAILTHSLSLRPPVDKKTI